MAVETEEKLSVASGASDEQIDGHSGCVTGNLFVGGQSLLMVHVVHKQCKT